jgi:hypothetical protein
MSQTSSSLSETTKMRSLRSPCFAWLPLSAALAAGCGSSPEGAGGPAGDRDAGLGVDSESSTGNAVGDASDAGDGAQADVDMTYPAFAPPNPPQVVTGGGPVMKAPKIVPVIFAADDPTLTAGIADFAKKVGQTTYWSSVATEYGAGPAVGLDPVFLTAADDPPATIDDSVIQSWLAAKLNAGDPAFPTPDENTVYALFYPPGVTVTISSTTVGGPADAGSDEAGTEEAGAAEAGGIGDAASDGTYHDAGAGDGASIGAGPDAAGVAEGGPADAAVSDGAAPGLISSCMTFGGYHQNIALDANHRFLNVAYAVIPRCDPFNGLTGIDEVTGTASHELLEAVTDPFPISNMLNPGYAQVDSAHFYWQTLIGGGEIGDMCAPLQGAFTKFAELPSYTVQRGWSNRAERAGQDPCVPALPNEVYFNSAPRFKDTVTVAIAGQTIGMTGAHIPVGMSETIELDLFSTGPTSGPWTVSARDQAALNGQAAQLQFSFDKTTGINGDKIQMTIHVLAAARRNREAFLIQSALGAQRTIWIGLVGN